MRNVHCAGDPHALVPMPPCGWAGSRRHDPHDHSSVGPYGQPASLTRDPCPQCGGEVELIAEDQGSGGVW